MTQDPETAEAQEKKKKEDALELESWREWKIKCAVRLCGKEHAEALSEKIRRSFMAKLNHFRGAFARGGRQYDFGEIDCAAEFDSALVEYEHCDEAGHEIYKRGHYGDEDHVRKAKCWKDFVWLKVRQSQDPELKVIRGQLVGALSVMNQIVEDYLSRNFPGRFYGDMYVIDMPIVARGEEEGVSAENAFKVLHPDADCTLRSSDDPHEPSSALIAKSNDEDEAEARVDKIGEDDFERYLEESTIPQDVWQEWRDSLCSVLDVFDCCILLAESYGLRLYREPEILAALGVSKTTAYAALEKVQRKLAAGMPREFANELRAGTVASRRFFMTALQDRVRAEKSARPLLSRIDEIKSSM